MKKILLGMSGGVDSSVSAVLLQKEGYEVYGITMKLHDYTDKKSKNDNNKEKSILNFETDSDARRVCEKLNIPHYTMNFKDIFKEKVINNFIQAYSDCKTPNPCIECNKYLKFGAMYEKAKELGIEYIATGHYAKTEFSDKYNRYVIKKANNIAKDQSYVLYKIPKDLLSKVVFPLASYDSKDEIRKIAKDNDLRVANKPDSEDICFIPDGNYKKFLEENSNLKPKQGNIVLNNGEILGKHNGLYNYTIGQRKGLGISYKAPLFVIGFNKCKNEVIVGEENELYKKEIIVGNINLQAIDKIENEIKVTVKTRYSSKVANATISKYNDQYDNKIKCVFDEPQARITPGQSAVFYDEDVVIGGGIIEG